MSNDGHSSSELSMLREIVRMLPASVTVQDENGNFLLANEAAAAQFNTPAADLIATPPEVAFSSKEAHRRRDEGIALLPAGRSAVAEEGAADVPGGRVYLTSHRPVRISDRKLLLS